MWSIWDRSRRRAAVPAPSKLRGWTLTHPPASCGWRSSSRALAYSARRSTSTNRLAVAVEAPTAGHDEKDSAERPLVHDVPERDRRLAAPRRLLDWSLTDWS